MQAPSKPLTPVTHFPNPPLLKATLQGTYHRILRDLWVRGDEPNAPLPSLSLEDVLGEGSYHLPRPLLRTWMIWEIVWFQASNKVLWASLPPLDPAEQLLPQFFRTALS